MNLNKQLLIGVMLGSLIIGCVKAAERDEKHVDTTGYDAQGYAPKSEAFKKFEAAKLKTRAQRYKYHDHGYYGYEKEYTGDPAGYKEWYKKQGDKIEQKEATLAPYNYKGCDRNYDEMKTSYKSVPVYGLAVGLLCGLGTKYEQAFLSKSVRQDKYCVSAAITFGVLACMLRGLDIASDNDKKHNALLSSGGLSLQEVIKNLIRYPVDNRYSHSVYSLVKEFPASLKQYDEYGFLPLHNAVKSDVRVVKTLLEAGADINAGDALMGRTALMMAAKAGDASMVDFLIDRGAKVNVTTRTVQDEKEGLKSALEYAVYYGHEHVIKTLLKSGATITCSRANRLTLNKFNSDIYEMLMRKFGKQWREEGAI